MTNTEKRKKYKATLRDTKVRSIPILKPIVIYVYAQNKADARRIAIEELGDKYRRYRLSNRPMYALDIEVVKEETT